MSTRSQSHTCLAHVVMVFGVLLVSWSLGAHAADLQQTVYDGTVGNRRIGLILNTDGARVVGGRYYYLRHLVDIPITGERKGDIFMLHEPAGTFALHFVGNGSEHGQALGFNNSVGLEGTWSNGSKTWPVNLQGGGLTPAAPAQHWYESITDQTDDVFEARTRGFYDAVLKGDREQAARYAHFPLRVNRGANHYELIRSPQQLAAAWPRLFTPDYVAVIRDASPHAMAVVQGYAMLGDGLIYFSDNGAEVLNLP